MTSSDYRGLELLKMHAKWCAPCRQMGQIMKGISYTPVDIEETEASLEMEPGRQIAIDYGVTSIPTLILVDDMGNEVSRMVGLNTRRAVGRWLEGEGYPEDAH